ncbi:hypothetical protein ACQYAD_06200 [Neobacillus sp. SM06]|uniref:hypothetical protein n=1 Tax=Neobacillus sp. SM06 TaxID=3422492 RepID=UPI003D271419
MVTAVIIPILCIYFFWITRKEMKVQEQKWLKAGDVIEEAVFAGEIKEITNEKQRFYYNRYLFVQELKLQTDTGRMTVKKITPLRKPFIPEHFEIGEKVRVYGGFVGDEFYVNRVEKMVL